MWWDGDMFALMVKVSCVSMSPSGLLTENVRMSACVNWDWKHGDRLRVEEHLCLSRTGDRSSCGHT